MSTSELGLLARNTPAIAAICVVIIQTGAIINEWNGITRQQLMKYSGGGAYADSAPAYVKFMDSADEGRR